MYEIWQIIFLGLPWNLYEQILVWYILLKLYESELNFCELSKKIGHFLHLVIASVENR